MLARLIRLARTCRPPRRLMPLAGPLACLWAAGSGLSSAADAGAGNPGAAAAAPALIVFHGRILTLDSADSIAEALAISGGKIVAVGTDRRIMALAGAGTR